MIDTGGALVPLLPVDGYSLCVGKRLAFFVGVESSLSVGGVDDPADVERPDAGLATILDGNVDDDDEKKAGAILIGPNEVGFDSDDFRNGFGVSFKDEVPIKTGGGGPES